MHNIRLMGSESGRGRSVYLSDEAAMLAYGKRFSTCLHPGLIIFLYGNLGAGKTTLARGILHGLGYVRHVKSPTYNLVEIYKFSQLYLYHFDFYRFNDFLEWEEAGFREYFNSESICLVEWPEKTGDLLPTADLNVFIEMSESGRNIDVRADTETGRRCLITCENLKTP